MHEIIESCGCIPELMTIVAISRGFTDEGELSFFKGGGILLLVGS